MSGPIMPEPLQKPLSLTLVPAIVAVAVAPLGKVSVVMIALAAGSQASTASDGAILGRASTIFCAGGGSPMTPVDEMNTSFGSQRKSFAAAAAVASTASLPVRPVKTLALPELTTIARALPSERQAWHHNTGGPAVKDRVNTPAIALPGASSASIMS